MRFCDHGGLLSSKEAAGVSPVELFTPERFEPRVLDFTIIIGHLLLRAIHRSLLK
jgi:hypothetical protein